MDKENQQMNMILANQKVWVVKVPKYIAEQWERAPSDMEVGILRVSGTKTTLSMTPDLQKLNPKAAKINEHEMHLCAPMSQAMAIFSQTEDVSGATNADSVPKLAMEGVVSHKFDCRPKLDEAYLKTKYLSKNNAKERSVELVKLPVNYHKPINDHQHNMEHLKRKKAADPKWRASNEAIKNMLFSSFEKHKYYSLKDLQTTTQHSTFVLKSILKEIAEYRPAGPHKGMWELKTEYRHYSKKNANEITNILNP